MESEIRSLIDRWNRAWLDKDAAVVDELMTDDYVYTAPDGRIHDRPTVLGVIRSPTYRIVRGSRSEVAIRLLGEDAAVVRRHWQGEVAFEGKSFIEDHQCVTVCQRTGDGWKIVFEQCSATNR